MCAKPPKRALSPLAHRHEGIFALYRSGKEAREIMPESNRIRIAIVLVFVGLFNVIAVARADNVTRVDLSSDRAFPESITASADGALYVGSPAVGGITRIPRGATRDEPWLKPGAFDTRSTFGVLAD